MRGFFGYLLLGWASIALSADPAAQLQALQWPATTARAVAQVNADYWQHLASQSPQELDVQLRRLGELGKRHPGVLPFLARHPETAGLLLQSSQPQAIVTVLDQATTTCYPQWLGLYSLYLDEGDRQQLTATLKASGGQICELLSRGFLGAEAWFAVDSQSAGGREYLAWLKDVLNVYQPDAKLQTHVAYVEAQGQALRHHLEDEPEFRARFRSTLWPTMARLGQRLGAEEYALLLDDADAWKLLQHPTLNGEQLLAKGGPAVLPLFVGHEALTPDLWPAAQDAILSDDDLMHSALMEVGHNPRFSGCFQRLPELDTQTRQGLIRQLFSRSLCGSALSCQAQDDWLRYCTTYTASALAEEVTPRTGIVDFIPLGTPIWKYIQGREVSASELAWGGVDAAITVITVGSGSIVTQGLKAAGKGAVAATTTQVTRRSVAASMLQQLKPLLGKASISGDVLRFGTLARKTSWSQALDPLRNVRSGVQLDVTGLARTTFNHGPLGRASFKRLDWLIGGNWQEARVFMRADRQLVLLPEKIPGSYLRAELFSAALEIPSKVQQYTSAYFFETDPERQTNH